MSFSPSADPFPISSGATPNWPAGYVPTAAEWNSWWSQKIDTDDAALMGGPWLPLAGGTMAGELVLAGPPLNPLDAVTKAYVDAITPAAGPFLPMSGGTMTGILTLATNPVGPLDAATRQYVDGVGSTANSALVTANAALPRTGGTMTGPLVLAGNPTSALGAATKQYVDGFLPLSGGTVTGSVTVTSNVTAGNLYTQGALYVNTFGSYEWNFTTNANGDKVQTFRSGWYDIWGSAGGLRSWVGGALTLMTLDGNGNLSLRGNLTAVNVTATSAGAFASLSVSGPLSANSFSTNTLSVNGNLSVTGQLTGSNCSFTNVSATGVTLSDRINAVNGFYTQNLGIYQSGSTSFMQFQSGVAFEYFQSAGTFGFYNGGNLAFSVQPDLDFYVSANAYKPGGGVWVDSSDARIKDVLGDFDDGLTQIRALKPKRFRFKGNHLEDNRARIDDREYVGLVAQDVESVMPALVTRTRGRIDGEEVDDLRQVDATRVIYALVNAVRELDARLTSLVGAAKEA